MGSVLQESRRLLPRWRPFSPNSPFNEHSSIMSPRPISGENLEFLRGQAEAYTENKNLETASELIISGVTLGEVGAAKDAAKYVLKDRSVRFGLRQLAQSIVSGNGDQGAFLKPLEPSNTDMLRGLIAVNKIQLNEYPNNPLLWLDQAYYYASQGQKDRAERCVRIAVSLNSENRFIVRSAARFYVHIDDYDIALSTLRRAPGAGVDPWIISADIAVSSIMNKTSIFVKKGMRAVKRYSNTPVHISELAASLGTLELESGAVRASKKLFHTSLINPTENTLAQNIWALPRIKNDIALEDYSIRDRAHEARAIKCSIDNDWQGALENCNAWANSENFSSRPFAYASFIASTVLGDASLINTYCERGLYANQNDPTLLNNIAVAKAWLGDTESAKYYLKLSRHFSSEEEEAITSIATEGLILFRENKLDEGRKAYSQALKAAMKLSDMRYRFLVTLFYLQEELAASHLDISPYLKRIKKQLDPKRLPELAAMTSRLEDLSAKAEHSKTNDLFAGALTNAGELVGILERRPM